MNEPLARLSALLVCVAAAVFCSRFPLFVPACLQEARIDRPLDPGVRVTVKLDKVTTPHLSAFVVAFLLGTVVVAAAPLVATSAAATAAAATAAAAAAAAAVFAENEALLLRSPRRRI